MYMGLAEVPVSLLLGLCMCHVDTWDPLDFGCHGVWTLWSLYAAAFEVITLC